MSLIEGSFFLIASTESCHARLHGSTSGRASMIRPIVIGLSALSEAVLARPITRSPPKRPKPISNADLPFKASLGYGPHSRTPLPRRYVPPPFPGGILRCFRGREAAGGKR